MNGDKWRIGSLFSGIGALDLAVEVVYDARTVWQVEREKLPAAVLRRHFGPTGSTVIERSIEDVDPAKLLDEHGPIDVLCGGFPCQDLSTAGKHAGLDGARSGLYSHVLRFAGVLRPAVVVVENVPILFSKYRDRVEHDFNAIGYGVRWVRCSAAAAGAPHLRRRVFLECTPGSVNTVTNVDDKRTAGLWPTPIRADGARGSRGFVRGNLTLLGATSWATPTARDWKSGQASEATHDRNARPLSEQAVNADRWTTPLSTDATKDPKTFAGGSPSLGSAARFATPRASDARGPGIAANAQGSPNLTTQVQTKVGRLNPEWHAALMGLLSTWTDPNGPSQHAEAIALVRSPKWPSGRGEIQHEWEPPRLVSGPSIPGRPARIKASGNAVVPQAAALALWSF